MGEFSLNDDWAYSKAIHNYVENGTLKFSFWQGFPDLPRFIVSSSICQLFSFSFSLLRLLTIFSFVIGLYVFQCNLKLLEVNTSVRWPLLLIFTFNPLSLYLTNTYLSDMFQLLLTLISFQQMLLYFKNQQWLNFILFCFVSMIATLNRQISLILPVVFTLIYFLHAEKQNRRALLMILSFAMNLCALFIYESCAKSNHILPGNYYIQLNNILNSLTHPSFQLIKRFAYYFTTSTICLGLLILPLTVSNWRNHFHNLKSSRLHSSVFLIYISLVILKIIFSSKSFPFVGNIFYHLGVGPMILTGFNTDASVSVSDSTRLIYILLNLIGGISFISAFISIIHAGKTSQDKLYRMASRFFPLFLFLYLTPLCFNFVNDRYLLLLLPFFCMAYGLSIGNPPHLTKSLIVFLPIIYFSFSSNYNYIHLNKARHKATSHLMDELNVSPDKIDGGFEFNGWYLSEAGKHYFPDHAGRWWWIDKDDYIISTVKLAHYSVESEFIINTLPPASFSKIYVLKKEVLN